MTQACQSLLMGTAVGHGKHVSAVCSLGDRQTNDAVFSYKQYHVCIQVNSSLAI